MGRGDLIAIKFKEFFYIPNLLSTFRLILLLPILILLAQKGRLANALLLGLIALAIISDYLDGFFARRLNQKTDLGRILDPLADKFLMVIGLVGFVIFRGFPLPLVALLAYRDLLILAGGLIVMKKTGEITESNFWGKINTIIISTIGFIYLLAPALPITRGLVMVSYLSVTVSGLSYLIAAVRILQFRALFSIIFIISMILIGAGIVYFCS